MFTSANLAIFVVVAIPAAVALYFVWRFRGLTLEARERAVNLGLEVDDVAREMPVSADRGRTYVIEPDECVEYLLPLTGYPHRWRLLMRPGGSDGWWVLEGVDGLPMATRTALDAIKADWTEEFLELEGTERGVAAYWQESGGQQAAERIHRYLTQVAFTEKS